MGEGRTSQRERHSATDLRERERELARAAHFEHENGTLVPRKAHWLQYRHICDRNISANFWNIGARIGHIGDTKWNIVDTVGHICDSTQVGLRNIFTYLLTYLLTVK